MTEPVGFLNTGVSCRRVITVTSGSKDKVERTTGDQPTSDRRVRSRTTCGQSGLLFPYRVSTGKTSEGVNGTESPFAPFTPTDSTQS